MNKITLTRIRKTDKFTVGVLEAVGEKFYTIENPWKDNEINVSCIPEGFYKFKPFNGKKFKNVWEIEDVDGRSFILMHVGNTVKDTQGCILVGMGLHDDSRGACVVQSTAAINRLRELMLEDNGVIEIKGI